MPDQQHASESKWNIPMQALEISAQPIETMMWPPDFLKNELNMHDPVHLICLAQIIVTIVLVTLLLILEG